MRGGAPRAGCTLRALAVAGALGTALGLGCSGAPLHDDGRISASGACDPDRLEPCERAIAEGVAEAKPTRELLRRYLVARAARDDADPWVRVGRALGIDSAMAKGVRHDAVIVADAGATDRARRAAAQVPGALLIAVDRLPAPKGLSGETLLLAMGAAAAGDPIVIANGSTVLELFPSDPLRPFAAGLAPILRDDHALDHLVADVALAASVRRAIDHAGELRYEEAAAEADRLSTLVAAADGAREPVVRARYALDLLRAAGIALDPEPPTTEASSALAKRAAPAASAPGSGYGDFFRVRISANERAEWIARRSRILRNVPRDRQATLDALFTIGGPRSEGSASPVPRSGEPTACAAAAEPPPMEGTRDLVFGATLAGALERGTSGSPPAGRLGPADWLSRYDAMVRFVTDARSAWAHAPILLAERGELSGRVASGTPTYQRVTELAAAHVRALGRLEASHPARFRALSTLPLVYAPGVLGDARLRDEVTKLMQASATDELARARDARGVFDALVAGVFGGMSLAPELRAPHFAALQSAFTVKLAGGLEHETGWGVAGLYALDLAYHVVTDRKAAPAEDAANVARALEQAPDLSRDPLAALGVSAARYVSLGIEGKLDPEQRAERFPPERRGARTSLRAALARLGDGDANAPAPPNNVLDDVTDLADGVIALTARIVAERRAAPAGTCPKEGDGPTPASRRVLARLGDVRQRILSHPRYRQGDGAWARRIRMVVTLLSDAMDIYSRKGDRPTFTVDETEAARALSGALADASSRETAEAIAAAHALIRGWFAATGPADLFAKHGRDAARAFGGLLAPIGGDKDRVALLDELHSMHPDGADTADLRSLLARYAAAFYAKKEPDQGDLSLLGLLVVSSVTDSSPPTDAVDLAARSGSRVAWALRFVDEVGKGKRGKAFDPEAYASGLRRVSADACTRTNVDDTVVVMGAIRSYADGKRREGRAALERVLTEAADARGFSIPRLTYRYEEKTRTRIFALSLGLSPAAGLLDGASSFQLGLGVRSAGASEGSLSVAFDPPSTREGRRRRGPLLRARCSARGGLRIPRRRRRGRRVRGRASGRRAGRWGALGIGSAREGRRALVGHRRSRRLGDRRGARRRGGHAIPRGRSLDGRQGHAHSGAHRSRRDRAAASPAPRPRLGERSAADRPAHRAEPARARGAHALRRRSQEGRPRSLRSAGLRRICAGALVESRRRPEEAASPALREERAARVRSAPDLGRVPRCFRTRNVRSRSTDAGGARSASGGQTLRRGGAAHASTTRSAHCSQTLVAAARELGRTALLDRGMRADLLTVAINCSVASVDPAFVSDLLELDATTRDMPDLSRNLGVALSVTNLALRSERWDIVAKLAGEPHFVNRWMTVSATAATAALAIDHASAVLNGTAVETSRTRGAFDLLCQHPDDAHSVALCADLAALRTSKSPADARKRARAVLERVVVGSSKKP